MRGAAFQIAMTETGHSLRGYWIQIRCLNPETVEVLPGSVQARAHIGSWQEEMLEQEMALRKREPCS